MPLESAVVYARAGAIVPWMRFACDMQTSWYNKKTEALYDGQKQANRNDGVKEIKRARAKRRAKGR